MFINEANLYLLIFGCKLPAAKGFRRWVTSEVLPALRSQGVYTLHQGEAPKPVAPPTRELEQALRDLGTLPMELSFARQEAIQCRLAAADKDLRIAELEHQVTVLDHLAKWQESTTMALHAQMTHAAQLREKGYTLVQIGRLLDIESERVEVLVSGWKALVALHLISA
ncbi:BRO-N domain-containing protein (plasmid) [Cupriavidus basilensis]